MLGAILGLVVVAGLPATLDPAALVGDLGSPRYLQREAAEAALARLGRNALPSLRAARDARDPEVRVRASAILARIEGTLLVQPTPIAFDFHAAPIGEVLRSINLQTGITLKLDPADDPAWADTRVTLRTAEPLPFWKGVDSLCEAGRLHYGFGVQPPSGRRESVFPLYSGFAPPPEPVWDSGPFRTQLASVHYQSEIQLSQARPSTVREGGGQPTDEPAIPRSVAIRQFYLQFLLAAEPRLSITQNGSPRVIEAVDDRGKSLLIPAEQVTALHSSGYFGMNPSPLVRFRVDLAYPETAGRRIGRLRGVMPVIAATRKPDPLLVPVPQAIGKTFRSDDVELTVRDIRAATDDQGTTIELTLRSLGGAGAVGSEVDPMAARLESPQQQLEILGADGEPLGWFPSGSLFDGEETRLTLSLMSRGEASKPAIIAYHGMTRLATEVPFEFRDVPIP